MVLGFWGFGVLGFWGFGVLGVCGLLREKFLSLKNPQFPANFPQALWPLTVGFPQVVAFVLSAVAVWPP
jgi:hypothetical protein